MEDHLAVAELTLVDLQTQQLELDKAQEDQAPGADIAQMNHETLEVRIFRS